MPYSENKDIDYCDWEKLTGPMFRHDGQKSYKTNYFGRYFYR